MHRKSRRRELTQRYGVLEELVSERNRGIGKQEGKKFRKGYQKVQMDQRESVIRRAVRLVRNKEGVLLVGSSGSIGPQLEGVGVLKSVCESASPQSQGGLWVTETWIHGRLTNHGGFRSYVARQRGRKAPRDAEAGKRRVGRLVSTAEQRWYDRHRKGREGWLGGRRHSRPGLVVLLDAEAESVARREALSCGIPTAGRVYTDGAKRQDRTYPRPWVSKTEGMFLLSRRRKRAVNEKDTAKV